MKKIISVLLVTMLTVFCFSELFMIKGYADDNAVSSEENLNADELERIIPQYNAQYIDYFYAGNAYIQVKIWIDSNTGGVTLTASDYCDFIVEGYVEDNWSERHYFNSSSDYTTYCQAYGGCYVTYQQITIVHVKITASSSDGMGIYEKTIPLTSMDLA